jgi:Family of unknown function (DUF5681)
MPLQNRLWNRQNQAMLKGGLRSTSFKPGVSGNPDGRPKRPETIEARRVVADVKAAARELTPEAMDTLKQAMADQRAPWSAKITAAIAVLDRGWGKTEQTVSANVSVFDQMTDDEQKTMLAALAALKAKEEDRPETLN